MHGPSGVSGEALRLYSRADEEATMNSGSRLEIHRRGALRGLLAVTGGLVTGLGFDRLRPAWAQGGPLTASGSGVNVKQMPSPDGTEMVPLRESFAFDAH